jgi:predicted HTH transcriptional regulator
MVLDLVRRDGRVTARTLMAEAGISKATATRRLTALMQRGLLQRVGRGRATCYVLRGR